MKTLSHIAPVLLVFLSGCASISSTPLRTDSPSDAVGLSYYLPKQDLVLTLTVAENKAPVPGKRSIAITPGPIVADTEEAYMLTFRRSQIATSVADVRVNANGLLDTTSAGSSTSQLSVILGKLAEAAAMRTQQFMPSDASPEAEPENLCDKPGAYVWVLDVEGKEAVAPPQLGGHPVLGSLGRCAIAVTTDVPSAGANCVSGEDTSCSEAAKETRAGLYYRQKLPVDVVVMDSVERASYSATVPVVGARSPRRFLPIPDAAFGTVNWSFAFTDGIPTQYKVDATSEVLGLISLPASVITAYSSAVVAGFNRGKDQAEAERNYLNAMIQLAKREEDMRRCVEATQSGDSAAIVRNCQ
jgi:hypothetical protein